MRAAFAVWITGRPACGKSAVRGALVRELAARGIDVAVLESDALRLVLTPRATYSEDERETFYRAMAHIGSLLVEHGVPVIFDATAHRRRYRASARAAIERFIEVYVDCPLDICMARDPKGIYRKAQTGQATTVPGLQVPYEPPEPADLVVPGYGTSPEESARAILRALEGKGYVQRQPLAATS